MAHYCAVLSQLKKFGLKNRQNEGVFMMFRKTALILGFTLILAFTLTACSDGNSDSLSEAIEHTTPQDATTDFQAENERLQAELNALQSEMAALQEEQPDPQQDLPLNSSQDESRQDLQAEAGSEVSGQTEITPTSLSELIIGEWFIHSEFAAREQQLFSRVFLENGNVEHRVRNYTDAQFGSENDWTVTERASWRLDGNTIRVTWASGSTSDFVLENNQMRSVNGDITTRERPAVPGRVEVSNDSIIGEWFVQAEFGSIFRGAILSFAFLGNGNMEQRVIHYVDADSQLGIGEVWDGIDVTGGATWSLNGNIVRITFDTGSVENFVFENNMMRRDDGVVLTRERPTIPEGLISWNQIYLSAQAFDSMIMRRLLGTWYFDVTTWTFNEDGTGIIDIPAVGGPASQIPFKILGISETSTDMDAFIWFDMEGIPEEIHLFAEFGNRSGGSVTLHGVLGVEPFILTRTFDISNMPSTGQLMRDALSVFSLSPMDIIDLNP
jgi:ubiquitin